MSRFHKRLIYFACFCDTILVYLDISNFCGGNEK